MSGWVMPAHSHLVPSETLLFLGGSIYTSLPERPWAQALAVEGGRIAWVGQEQELGPLNAARTVQISGCTVIPGLQDAHMHLLALALLREQLDLQGCRSLLEACRAAVRFRQEHPDAEWVVGHGWREERWSPPTLPDRVWLDAAVPDRPALLWRADGHTAWVNTLALKRAGIDLSTNDPPGGRIERDERGRPTGILRDEAAHLVSRLVPAPSLATRVGALRALQQELLSYGLVALHTMEGRDSLEALGELSRQGELLLRVLFLPPYAELAELQRSCLRPGAGSQSLRLGQLKLFADGSLGSNTAWLLPPTDDVSASPGLPIHDPAELAAMVREAHEAGWPCAIHAIGDAACRAVLDALAAAGPAASALPDRIEHVQLLHPADRPRLAALGVVASMQPVHVASDWPLAERLWGPRCQNAYSWRSLLATGCQLAFGSDAPVESVNPWAGLQVAITRQDLQGQPEGGWFPEERLSLAEAIAAFTRGVACAAGEPGHGVLAPGSRADFILLPVNPFELPAGELHRLRPLATFVGGQLAWGSLP